MITFLIMLYLAFTIFSTITFVIWCISVTNSESPLNEKAIDDKIVLFILFAVMISVLWSVYFTYQMYN